MTPEEERAAVVRMLQHEADLLLKMSKEEYYSLARRIECHHVYENLRVLIARINRGEHLHLSYGEPG